MFGKEKVSAHIRGHDHFVLGVAWDPAEEYILTISSDRTCRLHTSVSRKYVSCFELATALLGPLLLSSFLNLQLTNTIPPVRQMESRLPCRACGSEHGVSGEEYRPDCPPDGAAEPCAEPGGGCKQEG